MIEIDDLDRLLLSLLTKNGRATWSELATRVSLSVAATQRRVQRLRTQGVITGFTCAVDHAALGWNVEAVTEIRYPGNVPPEAMVQAASAIPEVVAVCTVAGDSDLLVTVRACDHAHLQAVISRLRHTTQATTSRTMIVLESWKRSAGLRSADKETDANSIAAQ